MMKKKEPFAVYGHCKGFFCDIMEKKEGDGNGILRVYTPL